jgi:uncharacterized phage protein (TIGR01671 family)
MNRPIKFRIWDKRNKSFFINEETKNVYFDIWQWTIYMSTCLIYPIEDCIFQQYTGLNDNNDDPIHEGDILKNPYDVSNKIIGQVLYESDYGGYIFQWKRRGQDYKITNLNCDVAFHSAIVGNIFEHSELLK